MSSYLLQIVEKQLFYVHSVAIKITAIAIHSIQYPKLRYLEALVYVPFTYTLFVKEEEDAYF